MNVLQHLVSQKLAAPPAWLPDNVHYLTIMGSTAYGVADTSEDAPSDMDLYGFCIPPKEMVFPHTAGHVWGFGRYKEGMPKSHFGVWQEHHIEDKAALGGRGRTYDLQVYSIVRFMQLVMECNPNMIDSLFTPETCVLHCTRVGHLVRENRKLFLHQGICDRFKGYAYAQVHKMRTKQPEPGSKRAALIEKHGWDLKFGYHIVRLLAEAEQLLLEGDLDLQRNREMLKSIRRGEWTLEQVLEYFEKKRIDLETARTRSSLPPGPDEPAIRDLLLRCLEMHYGSLDGCVSVPGKAEGMLRRIREMIEEGGW
ncbi:MAG: nucleotidyltransferase domain-containing protein [Gemmataceae bacterium]|nr:nucleotidyltransferase domain-containing protein [Gemmataceae bacterium]